MPELIWIKDATGASVPVAADVVTNLNGNATDDGEFAQRVKTGWGPDGEFWDVTPATPLPIAAADVVSALAELAVIAARLPAALSGGRLATETRSGSTSKGNKKLAVSGSTALSSVAGGIPSGATKALFRPDAAMNLNDDGTAADANDFPLDANVAWNYDGDQLAAVKFFGTGNVYVWFYA